MGRMFWKIFFGFWLTLLLVASAVGTLVWLHNRDRITELEMLVDSPRADLGVNNIASLLSFGGEQAVKDFAQRRQMQRGQTLPVFIVDDDGNDLLQRPVPYPMLRKAREAVSNSQQSAVQQAKTPSGKTYLLFVPRRDHPVMKNPLFSNHFPLLPLLIPFFASLIFSAGLAWYITRPLRYLSEASKRFAEGQLDVRVMSKMGSRQDEIADLGKDFDYMAQQIQQLVNAQKRLLNDVSHELRSPLARLQIAVEMSRQQPERVPELLQRMEKESKRLDELVSELLTLSRLEASVLKNELDYFDINGLINAIADDGRFEAESQNKKILYQDQAEVLLKGRIELIRRAIENIVRNALFHSKPQGQVDISLTQKTDSVEIIICDQGNGVPEEKLEQLFQPFVRIDETNQNATIPGYGLGLAIARRAIELHNGSIRAFNQQQGGLCIAIRLPLPEAGI